MKKSVSKIVFDVANVELNEKERTVHAHDIINDYDESENNLEISEEFEKYFGTCIEAPTPADKQPYLQYDSLATEMQAKLNQMLENRCSKQLPLKSTLAKDIEKQYTIPAFRVSKRKRKKENAKHANDKLANWFDMPRVMEISKEQEKDLMALKMRRVWDPKHFYKKSSTIQAASDSSGMDTSRYFQIGTIMDSHTDYYNNRVVKKDRKQTIIDELMNDAQLKAYNKRKLSYAMNKNSRLGLLMKRAKLRRQKQKLKSRIASKSNVPKRQPNTFKTFDL